MVIFAIHTITHESPGWAHLPDQERVIVSSFYWALVFWERFGGIRRTTS